jgi:hypothetical protein
LPARLSEKELEAKLFGNQPGAAKAAPLRPQPDWKAMHEQLLQHRHLTLQLLWGQGVLRFHHDDSTHSIAPMTFGSTKFDLPTMPCLPGSLPAHSGHRYRLLQLACNKFSPRLLTLLYTDFILITLSNAFRRLR